MRWIIGMSSSVTIFVLLSLWITTNSTAELRHDGVDRKETNMSKVLDHELLPNQSTIIGALRTVFQGTELKRWSAVELQGIFGHAFNWNMDRGAGDIWQEDYLDYHFGFSETLPEIARFRVFQAYQATEEGDFATLKAEAWNAVRESIDRGHPAIAWQPITVEQRDAGIRAGAWGVLMGYDESEKTYTVRHQYNKSGEAYTVRYDAFGHTDPVEWFCVLVYDGPAESDPRDIHLMALRNAIAFSEGTRSESEAYLEPDGRGLAAYEHWLEALGTEDVSAEQSGIHAYKLGRFRGHAAAYIHELVDVFPKAGPQLEDAAAHYDREADVVSRLEKHCFAARDAGGFTAETRAEARTMVQEALAADGDAIASIKAMLEIVR